MGRDRLGVDCVGVVLYGLERVGIHLDVKPYRHEPDFKTMFFHLRSVARRSMTVEPGGVLLFMKRNMVHVAVTTPNNSMVHSEQWHGSVLEVPFNRPWTDYPYSFWEIK